MGATVDLAALRVGLGPDLRPELRTDFNIKVSPVSGTLRGTEEPVRRAKPSTTNRFRAIFDSATLEAEHGW